PDTVRAGVLAVFGEALQPLYDVRKADVIVALDSDFLASGPGSLAHARSWAERRTGEPRQMNRLYCVESLLTPTGSVADHRLPVQSRQVEVVVRALGVALAMPGVKISGPLGEEHQHWVESVARDLTHVNGDQRTPRPKGSTLVIAGDTQPSTVHA